MDAVGSRPPPVGGAGNEIPSPSGSPAAFGGGGAGDFQKMYDNLSPQEKESIFKYIKQEIDSRNGK